MNYCESELIEKEDVNILCKYFEEERLTKLQGEIQLLKKECAESI